jgi:hypothetical protein
LTNRNGLGRLIHMEHDLDLRAIPELITESFSGVHEQDSEFGSVYLLCHYDRDYKHYGLFQIWDRFMDSPEWKFSLWYWDDELAEHLCDFPDHKWEEGNIPWVESAMLVKEHASR